MFLLSGLVTWVFFQGALQSSCTSLLGQASLVKQVRFPRQLLTFAVVGTNAVTLVVMFAVLVPVNLIFIPETRTTFWAALPLLLPLVALAGGIALVLATLTVVFRDVEHLLTAILLPWFFLTPVFYTLRPPADQRPSAPRPSSSTGESGRAARDRDPGPAVLRASCRSSAT